MPGFWVNPYPGNPFYSAAGYANVSEAAWRAALAKWFNDVDSIERTQVANPDADWVDTADGQYWFGTGPGTFVPGQPGTQGAQVTTTSAQGDPSVGP